MCVNPQLDRLSNDDKTWLDKRFIDKGFCGYEIAAILQERGYNVNKSSVHRYGQSRTEACCGSGQYTSCHDDC